MALIEFATPPHFHHGRVERIGFCGYFLYVGFRLNNLVEVWRVRYLVPSSWTKIYSLETTELFYAYFTFSKTKNCIYAFIMAIFVSILILFLKKFFKLFF